MQTLGALHGDHHHHVAQHPGQEDGGLEHGAYDPVQPAIILRGGAVESKDLKLKLPSKILL